MERHRRYPQRVWQLRQAARADANPAHPGQCLVLLWTTPIECRRTTTPTSGPSSCAVDQEDSWPRRGELQGDSKQDPDAIGRLPKAPPWRQFDEFAKARATTFKAPPGIVDVVNAALYLRRPLLITGDPGTGKSSLAYAVAHDLALGPVLTWQINSRSSLLDGLYHYDAIARLRMANLERTAGVDQAKRQSEDLGKFIKLGALGTALLANERPRVVLIDEIDKSDIDLPNDLLHVLENGMFESRRSDGKPSRARR